MITLAALAAASAFLNGTPQVSADTPAQHDLRMQWWRNARFGMFIHWGLYAVPAGKWGNQTNYGEWIREEAHIPVGEYEKFMPQFNPVKFDANAWAKMAKDAGMKYVVFTSKHHEGFDMWPAADSEWSIKNTPFKRDVLKELSNAVRHQGLTMGFYHSIMDWHHPDYFPRGGTGLKAGRPNRGVWSEYKKYYFAQVRELCTEFGEIGGIWFDGWRSPATTPKPGWA